MSNSIQIKITEPTNKRLDQFLVDYKIAASRSQMTKWIHEGCVLVNGSSAKASLKLKEGDSVIVTPPEVEPTPIEPEDIPLTILYEDSDLIVINKPADMVVHPGAGHSSGTLTNALLAHCKDLSGIGGQERPGIVHRLDRGTSGVIVVAKNDKAHISLSNQFKSREVVKIYWALVYGRMKEKEGTISTLITRSPSHRKKFSVSNEKGKDAVTHYKVLKEGEGVSFLEIRLETGRTHQIRVHLTGEGHSIVGDPLYGGHGKKLKQIRNDQIKKIFKSLDHTLLHARSLSFIHPSNKKNMECVGDLPEDFTEVLDLCF